MVSWQADHLASTTLDLARWSRMIHQGKAFPENLNDQFLDGVPAFGGTGDRYGLGVQIWTTEHGTCLGHGGWFPGYLSLMAYYPESKLAVAIQFNTDRYIGSQQTLRTMLDAFDGILIKE